MTVITCLIVLSLIGGLWIWIKEVRHEKKVQKIEDEQKENAHKGINFDNFVKEESLLNEIKVESIDINRLRQALKILYLHQKKLKFIQIEYNRVTGLFKIKMNGLVIDVFYQRRTANDLLHYLISYEDIEIFAYHTDRLLIKRFINNDLYNFLQTLIDKSSDIAKFVEEEKKTSFNKTYIEKCYSSKLKPVKSNFEE